MVDPQKLPYLLNLLDDESKVVREAVLKELATYGHQLEHELLKLENPPDKDTLNLIQSLLKNYRKSLIRAAETDFLFQVGEIIKHKKYLYRGVIVAADQSCMANDEWYNFQTRKTQKPPAKTQPWYHVLVHNAFHTTYAAQSNLEEAQDKEEINHILIPYFFTKYQNGCYIRNDKTWEL